MLPATPHTVNIEDLIVTVNHLSIEVPHYIPNISVFAEDAGCTASIKGRFTDRDFQLTADFTLTLIFIDTTLPISQNVRFTGNFSIKNTVALTMGYVGVRLAQHSYKIVEDYVKDKPIIDKDGKLFPIPTFYLSDFDFSAANFEG